jgi:hypothetical protein
MKLVLEERGDAELALLRPPHDTEQAGPERENQRESLPDSRQRTHRLEVLDEARDQSLRRVRHFVPLDRDPATEEGGRADFHSPSTRAFASVDRSA